jgi:predicted aspartyl protease
MGNVLDASPRIIVSIAGKQLVAGVDSGAQSNVLFLSGAEKIGVAGEQVAHDKPALAFGLGVAPVPAVEHTIDAADIGDLEILRMPVVIVGQNVPHGVDMLLGLDFFQRVQVWISYSSNSLIMQYPPGPSP